MKGILVREISIFLRAPINVALSIVVPLIYGLIFVTSLSGVTPTIQSDGVEINYLLFALAGVAVFAVLMFANMVGAAVYQERVSGMLREIATCPVTPLNYVMGKLLAGAGVVLAETVVLVAALSLIYSQVPVVTALAGLSAIAVLMLGALCLISLYSFIWNVINNPQTASLLTNLLTTTMIFSSAIFYSPPYMPTVIRIISYANPLTYIVTPLRAIMLDMPVDASSIAVLCGLTAVAVCLYVITVKHRMQNI